jgi:hypothetical protein
MFLRSLVYITYEKNKEAIFAEWVEYTGNESRN